MNSLVVTDRICGPLSLMASSSGTWPPTASSSSLLENKVAIVFGADGSTGVAVGREFAGEGAEVFLSGRTSKSVEVVAKEIADAGGRAHVNVVDALDEAAADAYLASVVRQVQHLPPIVVSGASARPRTHSAVGTVADACPSRRRHWLSGAAMRSTRAAVRRVMAEQCGVGNRVEGERSPGAATPAGRPARCAAS
jgi:3-oxoacyl-[acyl-carrier protein] reductase